MKILIINGPELDKTGTRETSIYGTQTFEDLKSMADLEFPELEITLLQSDSEEEILDFIGRKSVGYEGLIINPGILTHSSNELGTALEKVKIKKVEVHLSHIFAREDFRRKSLTAPFVEALISGMGMEGYLMAIRFLMGK
jgi:3-dehydroquinate dehydratase II